MAESFDINKVAGERVKAIRTRRQMTQAQLADLMGMTAGRLSQLESGGAWSLATLDAAAKGLRVPPASLLGGADLLDDVGPILSRRMDAASRFVMTCPS